MDKHEKEILIVYTVNIPQELSEEDLNTIKTNAVKSGYEILPENNKSLSIRLKPSAEFQEAIKQGRDFESAQTGGLKDIEENLGINVQQAQYRIEL